MELSHERRGQIAWIWLVQLLREKPVKDMRLDKLQDHYTTMHLVTKQFFQKTISTDVWNHLDGFLKLLVDGCMGCLEDEFAQTLTDRELDRAGGAETVWQLAYCLCAMKVYTDGSVRLNKDAKRKVHAKARELGISQAEARTFVMQLISVELLEIAFFGEDDEE